MNIPRPHVVFDCNTLFQAMARPFGPAAACLRLVERNQVTLFVSKATLRELRRILEYPAIQAMNPQLTKEVIAEFFGRLLYRAEIAQNIRHIAHLPRDPDDEIYLDLSIAVGADFLVTRDNDMLSLRRDHSVAGKNIRRRCPALRIVTPVEFLEHFSPPRR